VRLASYWPIRTRFGGARGEQRPKRVGCFLGLASSGWSGCPGVLFSCPFAHQPESRGDCVVLDFWPCNMYPELLLAREKCTVSHGFPCSELNVYTRSLFELQRSWFEVQLLFLGGIGLQRDVQLIGGGACTAAGSQI
jgi:hypothetical protein